MIGENKNNNIAREGLMPTAGGNIWHKIIGVNRKRTPVIVLHGGPASSHCYLEPLTLLAEERPVIFYDQLGCGKSDRTNDKNLWTIEHYVQEFCQIRKFLDLKKLHIVAHSWGTMIAVDYLLNMKSEGIGSVVLSAPCLSVKMWKVDQRKYLFSLPEGTKRIIEKTERIGNFESKEYQDAVMQYYKLHLCRLDPWPECLMKSFSEMNYGIYKYMWGPSEFTITGTLKNYERVNDLHKINVPVLFTCGEFDEATPETCNYYHKKLPESKISVFNGASHNHHLEKTNEYLKIVGDFLESSENN